MNGTSDGLWIMDQSSSSQMFRKDLSLLKISSKATFLDNWFWQYLSLTLNLNTARSYTVHTVKPETLLKVAHVLIIISCYSIIIIIIII
jgi:hypothetical protein